MSLPWKRLRTALVVDALALKNAGIVKNPKDGIKVLGDGAMTKKLDGQGGEVLQDRSRKNRGKWWESRGDLTCLKLSALLGRWSISARRSSTR